MGKLNLIKVLVTDIVNYLCCGEVINKEKDCE